MRYLTEYEAYVRHEAITEAAGWVLIVVVVIFFIWGSITNKP